MFLASLFYTFLILLLLSFILPESEIISNIAATGVFISILALIVGLIKPRLVLPMVHFQTRRKVLYTYIYLFFICFFMVGFLGEAQVAEPTKTKEKSTEMLAAAEDKKNKQIALVEKDKEDEKLKVQEEADKKEAEREAQEQAAAKQEAERKAQEQAAAKQEAERKAQEQAAAKQEAERKAQEQAAVKQEAERKAQEQAAAKQEAERKTQTSKQSTGTSGNGEAFVNDPSDDKESNLSCKGQIKGNMNSKIYHMPGGAYYDKTQDDIQWFCSPEEAEKAGFRASQR
ncbi:sunset domain-containing protein [Bacillus sp. UMB0893]|uniref:sunset domain-containing protein n=1 Tax=Bacillus sp. UMB0893 TaxID=2066053 RepID=UPI000C76A581|nr:protein TolA [Bacillus sp. UMB0893]PLR69159.1 protein TolA [Bacillus sp. UMB0893]QNG59375.1 protein TolA [Bacillus sp. PAMC26568]